MPFFLLDPGMSRAGRCRPSQTPRTTAAHRGKLHLLGKPRFLGGPQFGSPQFSGVSLCRVPRRRAASSMKTLFRTVRMRVGSHLGAVRLGHIHKFALPVQSTPPRCPTRRRGHSPPGSTGPRNKPGLLRMPCSDHRVTHQGSHPRGKATRSFSAQPANL